MRRVGVIDQEHQLRPYTRQAAVYRTNGVVNVVSTKTSSGVLSLSELRNFQSVNQS